MQIELFSKRLEKLSSNNPEFEFLLGPKITKEDILTIEKKLGVKFPNKLIRFYENLNGLNTKNPNFRIISIDKLILDEGKIHFSTFDNTVVICFLAEQLNSADEWTIVNGETDFEITKSISSFWSNKIWHWLEKGNLIWEDKWCE